MPAPYIIQPQVDQVSEFLEIAKDFTDPLEAVREAISNAYDAQAKLIQIGFDVESQQGEGQLVVVFQDNGNGMDRKGLQSFFDLGNSLSRGVDTKIGEKGHGTKVFLGCEELIVESIGADNVPRRARMIRPLTTLYAGSIPQVEVEEGCALDITTGTKITLRGFNRNRRDLFTHEQLRDYVLWFTKHGSIETEFKIDDNKGRRLLLKGVNVDDAEEIKFGHVFAKETKDRVKLFDRHVTDAPKYFVRKWVRRGHLVNHPEIKYQAVFAIEGDRAKRHYNKMLRGPGRPRRPGMYNVTMRYGLWLCKDYIPVERTVGWLGARSTDHLMFHAFINCQGFQLTANRGSVKNTQQPIIDDIHAIVDEIRHEIIESEEYLDMTYLEQESAGFETEKRELVQYKRRVDLVARQKYARFRDRTLIEPRQESGVVTLVTQVQTLEPDAFPFEVLDYETSVGIDALVKHRDDVPVSETQLRYLEYKFLLKSKMNHSFKHMSFVVAWDLGDGIRHDSTVTDLGGEERTLKKLPPDNSSSITRYYLESPSARLRIEVFLLRHYLKERFGLEFEEDIR